MSEKEREDVCSEDDKTASSMAASSVAKFFKEKGWKIISFFPNASCASRVKEILLGEEAENEKTEDSQ